MALKAGPKGKAKALDLTGAPNDLAQQRVWFMSRFCGVNLYPWQRDQILSVGGLPRPRVAYTQVPRKNGKTLTAAALALTEICLLPQRHVYAISDSERNLNSVLMREVRDLIYRSPDLRDAVHVFKWGIECPQTGSFLEVRPGNFRASQGINPHLVLFDEVHLQRSDEIWSGMQMSGAARTDAMLYGITTPGYDLTSLAHDLYQQVKAGNENIHGTIFEPHDLSCSPDEHDAWEQSNPCYSIPGFLAGLEYDRLTLPEHEFRRFRLGQWTATASAWLPYGSWDACAITGREVMGTEPITLGFDGSFSGDSTALVGATVEKQPHLFVLGAWENPGRKGWRVPRDEVDAAIEKTFATYNVLEIAADPPYWHRELEDWSKRYGETKVLAFATNRRERMAPATTAFYTAVMEKTVTHDGDTRLARHVSNAVVRPTAQGDVVTKVDKDSPAKIDLAIAAIVAHDRARYHANVRRPVHVY